MSCTVADPDPQTPTQNAIIYPPRFTPGHVDVWVSNEIIEANLSALDIWPLLATITRWESYYNNCSQIEPPSPTRATLQQGDIFKFATFGLPQLPCRVEECVEPMAGGGVGRLAWRGWLNGEDGTVIAEAYHAWLVEDLEGGRVRVLTQESQLGQVVREMSKEDPKRMLNGHQDWLLGLVGMARKEKEGA